MGTAGLLLALAAAVPQWVEEPRITRAEARTDDNVLMFDLGHSISRGRVNVQVREMDGRFVYGETVPVYDGRAGLGFKPGSVGPWRVTLNLVGDRGRLSPDRRLTTDVDWVPRCEGESPEHPCPDMFVCGNDSRFARVLILTSPGPDDPLWLRVRRAPPDIAQLVTAATPEANGVPLRVVDDEDDGGGTHFLLLAPQRALPARAELAIALGMHVPDLLRPITGHNGQIDKESRPPPAWRGDIQWRMGPAASLELKLDADYARLARIRVDYPGQRDRSRSIMVERDGDTFTVGCVGCGRHLELLEDTDVTLTVELVSAGRASAARRVLVHTPSRADGRNGRRPTPWVTAAVIPEGIRGEPMPARTPPPLPMALRVLFFAALPFVAGYVLVTLRRRMSSPSAPSTARRKPKSRNSAIG